jgi:hypothetical protein
MILGMDYQESIDAMRSEARSIMAAEWADDVLEPWGETLASVGLEARTGFSTSNAPGGGLLQTERPSVSVYELGCALASRLSKRHGIPWDDPGFPYHRAGMNAAHRTEAAVVWLRELSS